MKELYVDKDELWPYWSVVQEPFAQTDTRVAVDDDWFEEYDRVATRFFEMQRELGRWTVAAEEGWEVE